MFALEAPDPKSKILSFDVGDVNLARKTAVNPPYVLIAKVCDLPSRYCDWARVNITAPMPLGPAVLSYTAVAIGVEDRVAKEAK